MEGFLEVILDVEREAARLEHDADERLLACEKIYRDALAHLEESTLSAERRRLEKTRKSKVSKLSGEIESIEAKAMKRCELLDQAAESVGEQSRELLLSIVLPEEPAP